MSVYPQVMGWVNQYHDTLRDLGIEEDELGFPSGSDRGIGMLTDKYIDRMRQQLNSWFTNILQVMWKALHECCPESATSSKSIDLLAM